MKRLAKGLLGLLLVFLAGMFAVGPQVADRIMNRTVRTDAYPASDRATALHRKLEICDMHADSLLWGRDLNVRATHGHVDVPRLIEANVALQGFFLVTHTPRGLNIYQNDDSTDNITLLGFFGRWPSEAWTSRKARALYLAGRLRDTAERSQGRFTLIRCRADLTAYLERRAHDPQITAGFLGVEGAHCLDGDVGAIEELYQAGVRVVAPTHFFDNFVGGSSAGVKQGGLTPAGRQLIGELEKRRMLVDLAHASPATVADVLAMATRPVLVSHTGVRGTCDNPRNLTDAQLTGVAHTGGVVGIAYFEAAVCGTGFDAVVRAIKHAVGVIGVDHVALGSDFDGAVKTQTDVTGLVHLTDELLAQGFSEEDVAKIMGGNVLKLLASTLP